METDPESTAEIKSQDMQRDDTEVQEEREQSEILQEDEILSVNQHSKYLDHCSLSLPSSQIRFRGTSKARIYPDARGQFILEEDGNKKTAKWVETSGAKLRFLRFLYTLVAAFWVSAPRLSNDVQNYASCIHDIYSLAPCNRPAF